MLQKILILVITSLLITSCNSLIYRRSGQSSIKSSNGEIYSHKKNPIYNKKYIKKAKENIANNIHDAHDDITEDNIRMYKEMMMQDVKNHNNNVGPRGDSKLQKEIMQIKEMLHDTKQEMASYRCPTAKDIEKMSEEMDSDM